VSPANVIELQLTQMPLQRSELSQNKRLRNSLRSRGGKYDGIIVAPAVEFLFRVFSVRALVGSGRARLQGAALHLSAAVRPAAHTLLVPFLSHRAPRQEARPQAARCRVDLMPAAAVSRSQVVCHDLVSEHSLDHQLNPELDSRQACELAADHVLALEAKAGNSVALLRPVCLVVHGLQRAQARCLPDHPQASCRVVLLRPLGRVCRAQMVQASHQ
jgi:hypothetical protein